MHIQTTAQNTPEQGSPLESFSGCHEGILKHIEQLAALPSLLGIPAKAAELKASAANLYRFYHDVIIKHHREEEEELFTAVESALHADPVELVEAKEQIEQLIREHRHIESLWKLIEPDLKLLAKGKLAWPNGELVSAIASYSVAHAHFEETTFLPLAARLLDANGMAALGMSLHIRHHPVFIPAYI